MTELGCSVDLPEGWLGLSLDEDPSEFGRRTSATLARELREHEQIELTADHIADLAADLAQFTGHAQESGVLFAGVHLPDPTGPVVALLECLVVDPTQVELAADVDALAKQMAEPDPALAWSDVAAVDLSAGVAVRAHEITAASPGSSDQGRTPVEKVVHFLPVDEANLVVLTTSWTSLALTERLVGMADGIAESLVVGR